MAVLVGVSIIALILKAPCAKTSAVAFFAAVARVACGVCGAWWRVATSTPLEMAVAMGTPLVVWLMASVRIVRTRVVVWSSWAGLLIP